MNKESPGFGRIMIMVVFTLSCFGLLLFLWLAFGGPLPLKPQGYRIQAAFPEAALLVKEADVRIAGVNVGKVKAKRLAQEGSRTIATLDMDAKFAPVPADTRASLRQKTLLGETYIELTPGSQAAPKLPENGMLARSNVQPSVNLDEILRIFDEPTRRAFEGWVDEFAGLVRGSYAQDLNNAFGNLPRFANEGGDTLTTLDQQGKVLQTWISKTGPVFDALNRRDGELRDLIVNSNKVFAATAARDDEIAETIRIFPTFLDETRATMTRLETFARDTRPVVNDLKPVADDLGPTVRDLGALGPDLEDLFRKFDPLISESRATLPQAARLIRGLEPFLAEVHDFLPEINPLLAYLNYTKQQLAAFISVGGGALQGTIDGEMGTGPRHDLPQIAAINERSFLGSGQARLESERGNSYIAPNALNRARALGIIENFDNCDPNGGEQEDPADGDPPCFIAPPSLWDGNLFPRLQRGFAPVRPSPFTDNAGTDGGADAP